MPNNVAVHKGPQSTRMRVYGILNLVLFLNRATLIVPGL